MLLKIIAKKSKHVTNSFRVYIIMMRQDLGKPCFYLRHLFQGDNDGRCGTYTFTGRKTLQNRVVASVQVGIVMVVCELRACICP